jgi:dTMP kinase
MFIVIDGPDGTGKTTLVGALSQRLAKLPSIKVRETREPYTPWLREWLSDPTVQARELLVAFAHDRNLHLREVVEPSLARGEVVVCDRYVYSTVTYQTLHNPEALVRSLVEGVRKPDLALVLTCPIDVAMKRICDRGLPPDRYDQKREVQERVSYAYRACAAEDRFALMVDASGTAEATLETVWKIVCGKLWLAGLTNNDWSLVPYEWIARAHARRERLDYTKAPEGYTLGPDGWSAYGGRGGVLFTKDWSYTPAEILGKAWSHFKRSNDPPLPHHPWRDSSFSKFAFAFTTPEGTTITSTTDCSEEVARMAAWRWYDGNVMTDDPDHEASRLADALVRAGCPVET